MHWLGGAERKSNDGERRKDESSERRGLGFEKKERKRSKRDERKKGIKNSLKLYNFYAYAPKFESVLFINVKYFGVWNTS